MRRRKFLKHTALGLSTSCFTSCSVFDQQPNFIILIADDLRWDSLGIFNPILHTPNLDQLAKDGIVFLNNFVTTAICPTSRASIFTGLYAHDHQIWDFNTPLNPDLWQLTYPYQLQQAGYTTAFIGKYGLGGELPTAKFDYWQGFEGQGEYFSSTRSEHLTSYLTGQAEEFIAATKTPFCLTLSHKAPHVDDAHPDNPLPGDSKFARLYENVQLPILNNASSYSKLPEFLQHSEARVRYEQLFDQAGSYQNSLKQYYRLVTGLDDSVSRIVRALEKRKLIDNTYIIFTSDNGLFLGEKGLVGKWFGFEPAIRTPLIIKPPAKFKQDFSRLNRIKAMTLNIDLAPTILALAKVNAPVWKSESGKSLVGLNENNFRTYWLYEHLFTDPVLKIPVNLGIRTERYKYLYFPEYKYEMLFDLAIDPMENNNLAANSNYLSSIKKYRELINVSSG